MESGRRNVIIGAGVALVGLGLLALVAPVCSGVLLRDGIWLQECPEGEVVPTVALSFDPATATLSTSTTALYVTKGARTPQQVALSGLPPTLAWVRAGGATVPVAGLSFVARGDALEATLPPPDAAPDARALRATVQTPFGPATAELPRTSPPGSVSLTLDASRHAPGEVVNATVQLRAPDGAPLREELAGRFVLLDEAGVAILEEPGPTDREGRARLSLPLDPRAPPSLLQLRWEAGELRASRPLGIDRDAPELPPAPTSAARLAAQTPFQPERVVADRLVSVLAELHDSIDAWRRTAGDEPLTDAVVDRLLAELLVARAARGEPTTDAFGRPLSRATLPRALEPLLSPRALAGASARALAAAEEVP